MENPTHTLLSFEYLIRLLKEYDELHGSYPESYYEGQAVAEFLHVKLGREPGELVRDEDLPDWFENNVEYSAEPYNMGDMLTVEEFVEMAKSAGLINYDGFGHPVKDGKLCPTIEIRPSRYWEIPEDATHIQWYNR